MIILLVIGAALTLIGGIWFLVEAFRTSVLWGLGCLLLPFVSLVFLVMHWQDAKRPFFWQLGGIACLFLATLSSPLSQDGMADTSASASEEVAE